MSILNLGLGLDTSGVKKELEQFEGWLKGHAPTVQVSLDIRELNKQLQSATALPVVQVRVNSAGVKSELESVVSDVFKVRRSVIIDTAGLTSAIHDAANKGLSGLKTTVDAQIKGGIAPQGVTGAAHAAVDNVSAASTIKQFEHLITAAIRDAVAFTSDMMAKSFQDVTASQAKAERVRSNVSATQSVTTPEGIRVSRKVPIHEEADIEAVNAALREEMDRKIAIAQNRQDSAINRAAEQISKERADPRLDKDAAFAQMDADRRAQEDKWALDIERAYASRTVKEKALAERKAKDLDRQAEQLANRVRSEMAQANSDESDPQSIAALRARQKAQFEAAIAGMDEHRKKQAQIAAAWDDRDVQQKIDAGARVADIDRAFRDQENRRAKESLAAHRKLVDATSAEVSLSDTDTTNPQSIAALRERRRAQFESVLQGMDEHRKKQAQIAAAWDEHDAQQQIDSNARIQSINRAFNEQEGRRAKEGLKAVDTSNREESARWIADQNNKLAAQLRSAKGIYNSAKMEMSRMLNDQGASISALAVMMQKMPNINPLDVVNNPAKVEQAKSLNLMWSDAARGAESAEKFMARYVKTTAKAKDSQTELNKAVREFYASQRFELSGKDIYTPRGVQVGAAAATIDKFGPAVAGRALGNESLIAEADKVRSGASALDDYRKKVSTNAKDMEILRHGLNDAHSAARGLAGSLGMIWLTWGQTLPLAGMAAIGFSLRQTYTVGKDVEYQLKFVQALSNGATANLNDFNDAVRGAMVAPAEAAKALRGLAQNGLEAREAIQALPTILKLATAGEMGLAEAALGATGVMAAFNLGVGDLGRVADVFSFAAARSNTSVGAMVESMKQASSVSDQYGVSLEETAASLAVLAKRNIEGSSAGTAFRNMMTELAAPSDKARKAMESVGLQVFDGQKKLKGYKEIMESLRAVMIGLDQESRINFLNQVFDERGAKAANALLSDMDLLRKMFKDIGEESTGFTDKVNSTLNQSVEGSVRGLISDFQQVGIKVFDEGANSVKAFVEALREGARSEEFKTFLRTAGELVINVTQFMVEHVKVIGYTVAGWMALRAALASFTAVTTLIATLKALEVGLTAVRVSALAAMGALTGGLAIVGTLAAEYLLLRDNTSEAQKAHENFQSSMARNIETMGRELDRLNDTNTALEKRNRLMAGGMSYEDAKAATEGKPTTAQEQQKAVLDARQAQIDRSKAAYEAWAKAPFNGGRQSDFNGNADIAFIRKEARDRGVSVTEAIKQMDRDIAAERMSLDVAIASVRTTAEQQIRQRIGSEKEKIYRDMEDLRHQNAELLKQGKTIKAVEPDLSNPDLPVEEMRKRFEDYKTVRNAELEHRMAATRDEREAARRAEAEANRARALKLTSEIKSAKEEDDVLREQIKQREQLSRAKYDPAIYGEATVNLLNEIEAQNNLTKTYETQQSVISKLGALKKAYNRQDEVQHIDEAIEAERRLAEATRRELETYKAVQEYKSQNRQIKDQTAVVTVRAEQDNDFQRIMREITQKREKKVSDPLDVAENEARTKVEEADAQRILTIKQKIARLEAGRLKIEDDISRANEDQLPALKRLQDANESDLETEREVLRVIIEQSKYNSRMAGDLARKNEEYARSWQGGWDEYWRQFRDGAVSNAKIVQDVMSTTTTAMTDMFTNFVMTGKMDFKSFAKTIMAEAARLMASRAVLMLLNMFASMAMGGGSSPGVGVINGSAGTPEIPPNVALKGGVHPAVDGLPSLPLQKFRAGGVSYGPTYTLHAEGARSEAYVPLEDGRNIPVKIVSQPASGTVVQVNTTVKISSDGKATVSSQASSEDARALGAVAEQAVTEAMIKQTQPGGIIYNFVRG